MNGGTVVCLAVIAELLAYLWVTDPKHKRTRRVLGPVARAFVGACVRIGLID